MDLALLYAQGKRDHHIPSQLLNDSVLVLDHTLQALCQALRDGQEPVTLLQHQPAVGTGSKLRRTLLAKQCSTNRRTVLSYDFLVTSAETTATLLPWCRDRITRTEHGLLGGSRADAVDRRHYFAIDDSCARDSVTFRSVALFAYTVYRVPNKRIASCHRPVPDTFTANACISSLVVWLDQLCQQCVGSCVHPCACS
jgi:hypothetical protein